jgi:hypothetical protein
VQVVPQHICTDRNLIITWDPEIVVGVVDLAIDLWQLGLWQYPNNPLIDAARRSRTSLAIDGVRCWSVICLTLSLAWVIIQVQNSAIWPSPTRLRMPLQGHVSSEQLVSIIWRARVWAALCNMLSQDAVQMS